jgi:hypothetical protein
MSITVEYLPPVQSLGQGYFMALKNIPAPFSPVNGYLSLI